ncbi:MAG TPA: tetratricopeptide repeat protein [Tepidisphaeraceae bacterium]|jgi:tetratricopeptide (TPR) repeat protein
MTGPLYKVMLIAVAAGCLAGCHGGGGPTVTANPPSPDGALAHQENERAFALIQEGKYDQAETILKKAIAADLTFGPAHNNLGLVYYYQKRYYDAAWEFDYAIRLMPYQPDPRNNLGLVFEETWKYADAADAYERARKMAPDNPEFIGNLARVRIKRGDRDNQTRELLEELTFKDPRPEWRDWARTKLFEFNARRPETAPTTKPARSDQ